MEGVSKLLSMAGWYFPNSRPAAFPIIKKYGNILSRVHLPANDADGRIKDF